MFVVITVVLYLGHRRGAFTSDRNSERKNSLSYTVITSRLSSGISLDRRRYKERFFGRRYKKRFFGRRYHMGSN